MSKHHELKNLTFNNFSGYYGSVTEGYGGFVWSDVDFLNASYWQNVKTNWCDTGYQNVVDGAGLAYTWGQQDKSSFGYFASPSHNVTFNLKSMVAASAWETNQPFTFTSYVFKGNQGFVKDGTYTAYLNQTAKTINFSSKTGFSNISAVLITSGSGTYGNTCSYGTTKHTYGNELAFDNLKVKWNGALPHGSVGAAGLPLLPRFHHGGTPVAHLVADLHQVQAHAAQSAAMSSHHAAVDYHAELLSLPGHDAAGLTADFHLPVTEHFGT